MDIIDIAKDHCFSRQVVDGETGLITFRSQQLQQFAQRIEQPHLQRIAELEALVKGYRKDFEILSTTESATLRYRTKQIEQLRDALADALRYKRADEKLVDIINGLGEPLPKKPHGRIA